MKRVGKGLSQVRDCRTSARSSFALSKTSFHDSRHSTSSNFYTAFPFKSPRAALLFGLQGYVVRMRPSMKENKSSPYLSMSRLLLAQVISLCTDLLPIVVIRSPFVCDISPSCLLASNCSVNSKVAGTSGEDDQNVLDSVDLLETRSASVTV